MRGSCHTAAWAYQLVHQPFISRSNGTDGTLAGSRPRGPANVVVPRCASPAGRLRHPCPTSLRISGGVGVSGCDRARLRRSAILARGRPPPGAVLLCAGIWGRRNACRPREWVSSIPTSPYNVTPTDIVSNRQFSSTHGVPHPASGGVGFLCGRQASWPARDEASWPVSLIVFSILPPVRTGSQHHRTTSLPLISSPTDSSAAHMGCPIPPPAGWVSSVGGRPHGLPEMRPPACPKRDPISGSPPFRRASLPPGNERQPAESAGSSVVFVTY
jgi:hypothetical protein